MANKRGVRVCVPAKINLHLRVGQPMPDGFHGLVSWMTTLKLFDTLTLVGGSPGAFAMDLQCDDPSLSCDQSNLVVRAGQALAGALAGGDDRQVGRVSAALLKRIPAGAGLGGGSSDAAGALRGLDRLWSSHWDPRALADLSVQLGSDVPFFFYQPSAVCTGRGQFVRPTPPPAAPWAALFLTGIHMPTPAVYRQFDSMKLGGNDAWLDEPDWRAWAELPAGRLLGLLVNDLEAPAFALCPELRSWRDRLETALARPVRMSGSGSALFTLYDSPDDAQAACEAAAACGVRATAHRLAPKVADVTEL